MKEYIVVFAWGFVPATLWLAYHIINDMWKNRWNSKFRGTDEDFPDLDPDQYHATDLEAFLWNFVDSSTPNVAWWKVIVTPFIVGAVLSMIWWLIYATVQVVA